MAGTSLKGTLNNEAVKISAMYPFRELTSSTADLWDVLGTLPVRYRTGRIRIFGRLEYRPLPGWTST
jgi:hypothetical protein